MQFRNILLTMLLAVTSLTTAIASNEPTKLYVRQNGTVVTFQLSEKPVITFDAKNVYISTSDFSAAYENIDSLYFKDETVVTKVEKIDNSVKQEYNVKFTDGHTVIISGFTQAVRLDVYSVNGMKLNVGTERSGDSIIIDLANQPNGIYIIRANSHSFKISKR